jgi:hypothetical protein
MSLQVLLSTMHNHSSILSEMNLNAPAIVVNQCDNSGSCQIKYLNNKVLWIDTLDRGLSKSRNLAISNSSCEFCLLADDDLVYVDNFADKILDQFRINNDASVIVFIVEGIEKEFKKYHTKQRKLNLYSILKVSSVQIAFKRSDIVNNNIRFKEEFGSGSIFSMGEENIFLNDCLKSGLIIYFVPVKIADLHLLSSSWFKGFNRKYFHDQGASLTAFSKSLSLVLIFSFALKKRNLYKGKYSYLTVIRYMLIGRRKFLKFY